MPRVEPNLDGIVLVDWSIVGPVRALDVCFDGRRIFSLATDRAHETSPGRRLAPWPVGLRGYLRGSAEVTVRDHLSGEILGRRRLTWTEDDPDRPVQVVDEEGHDLAFDKWGQPGRAFEGDSRERAVEVARLAGQVIGEVQRFGRECFVAYGTLLGAVRSGQVIGHDFDADVAYLTPSDHPADVAADSFALQRFLSSRGWETSRPCDAMYQIRVRRPGDELPPIDIFPSYFAAGRFEIPPLARGDLGREQILPLGEVVLEGQHLPAPAQPEALLEATYGEDWRVPNPAFSFSMPAAYARSVAGRMGNHLGRPGRWDRWYREDAGRRGASPFVEWVAARLADEAVVLDVGCGTGADTWALAGIADRVIGADFSPVAIARAREGSSHTDGGASPTFLHATLYDLRATLALASHVAVQSGPKALYGRYVVDALGESGRRNLLLAARTLLLGGGWSYFEVRTRRGNPFAHQRPAPWAGVPDLDLLLREIGERGGRVAEVEHDLGPEPRLGRQAEIARVAVRW